MGLLAYIWHPSPLCGESRHVCHIGAYPPIRAWFLSPRHNPATGPPLASQWHAYGTAPACPSPPLPPDRPPAPRPSTHARGGPRGGSRFRAYECPHPHKVCQNFAVLFLFETTVSRFNGSRKSVPHSYLDTLCRANPLTCGVFGVCGISAEFIGIIICNLNESDGVRGIPGEQNSNTYDVHGGIQILAY